MPWFDDEAVPLELLRGRAHNLRWAEQPHDVIPLTAADPDFRVAPVIGEAIADYVRSGVLSYGPAEGLSSFREVVSRTLRDRRGMRCEAQHILPTNGAASAMFILARHVLEPGDEAIIFDPVDFLFRASVEAAGGVVKRCAIDTRTGTYDLHELRRLATPRTKLLGVCSPHNPIGRVWTEPELRSLGEFAVEHDLTIMADEIWSDIVYAPHRFISLCTLSDEIAARTVSVYGFSKTFGLAGLRVGFLVSPDDETAAALLEASGALSTAYGVPTPSQVGAQAAYEHAWPWAEAFLTHLRAQRDYALERVRAMPGVSCREPEGTYVMFPNVSELGLPSGDIAASLLDRERVAIVPGEPQWFGPGAEGHLRICFSTSRAILAEGLDRLEAGLERLTR